MTQYEQKHVEESEVHYKYFTNQTLAVDTAEIL